MIGLIFFFIVLAVLFGCRTAAGLFLAGFVFIASVIFGVWFFSGILA